MNSKNHLLKKKDMAESLGISVQAFDKWRVEPVLRDGRSAYFSARCVLDNRLANEAKKNQPSGEDLDIVQERARLTFHQANIAELEEDLKRGLSILAENAEMVWAGGILAIRAKLLSLPTKMAPRLVSLKTISEIECVLKEGVDEALSELSEYDPEDYSGANSPESI